MYPTTFVPTLYIGVGELGCFFTLRETYLHGYYVSGHRHTEVRSFHHFNLSRDPDEAFEKAQEASERMDLKLTTSRESLCEEMNATRRANAAEKRRTR